MTFYKFLIQDPNWYKARRNDGREGMIPFNYVVLQSESKSGGMVVAPPKEPKSAAIKGEVKLQTMP